MTEGKMEDRGPIENGGASARGPHARLRPKTANRVVSALVKGAANLVFVCLTVCLTYFFAIFFASPPAAHTATESAQAAIQKIEELRAKDHEFLTTYGPINPQTKMLRVPIDRAMELTIADVSKPKPPAPVAAPGAPAVAGAPIPGGMSPSQLYQAVCIACHDVDGKGSKVRVAMPTIPDMTDPKFQASRTEAELEHSILLGKGTLMLPMKDKLDSAHIDVKAMVAFMRAFATGKQIVSAAPVPAPAVGSPAGAAPAAGVPAISALGTASTPTSSPQASPAQAAKARAGSAIFMTNCIPCHGPDGRGAAVRAAMPVIPDFTNREWQVSHQTAQLSNSILEGKGTLMPSWRGRVSPVQAGELIAFIRTLGPPDLALADSSKASFEERFRQLQKQWQELDRQAQLLVHP